MKRTIKKAICHPTETMARLGLCFACRNLVDAHQRGESVNVPAANTALSIMVEYERQKNAKKTPSQLAARREVNARYYQARRSMLAAARNVVGDAKRREELAQQAATAAMLVDPQAAYDRIMDSPVPLGPAPARGLDTAHLRGLDREVRDIRTVHAPTMGRPGVMVDDGFDDEPVDLEAAGDAVLAPSVTHEQATADVEVALKQMGVDQPDEKEPVAFDEADHNDADGIKHSDRIQKLIREKAPGGIAISPYGLELLNRSAEGHLATPSNEPNPDYVTPSFPTPEPLSIAWVEAHRSRMRELCKRGCTCDSIGGCEFCIELTDEECDAFASGGVEAVRAMLEGGGK